MGAGLLVWELKATPLAFFGIIGNCGAAAEPLLVVPKLLEVVLSSRGDAPGTAAGGGIAAADAAVLAAAVLFSPAAAGCGSC